MESLRDIVQQLESAPKNSAEQTRYENLIYEVENRDFEVQNLVIQYHQVCKINKTYLNSEIQIEDRLNSVIRSKHKNLLQKGTCAHLTARQRPRR